MEFHFKKGVYKLNNQAALDKLRKMVYTQKTR